MITPDELVEMVVAALDETCRTASRRGLCNVSREHDCAIAAIALCMEEAAKVAEAFPARTHGNLATAPYAAAEQAGDEIAAAIRAMKNA